MQNIVLKIFFLFDVNLECIFSTRALKLWEELLSCIFCISRRSPGNYAQDVRVLVFIQNESKLTQFKKRTTKTQKFEILQIVNYSTNVSRSTIFLCFLNPSILFNFNFSCKALIDPEFYPSIKIRWSLIKHEGFSANKASNFNLNQAWSEFLVNLIRIWKKLVLISTK